MLHRQREMQGCLPRRGVATLEFVLVMPVLFLTLLAGVQFASLLVINNTIQAAAIEASRLATMECDATDIENQVNQFLDVHGMSLGTGVSLTVQDSTGTVQTSGDATLSSSLLAPLPPASFVRATLVVSLDATPAPNLLASFCLDFQDNQFELCHTRFVPQCACP